MKHFAVYQWDLVEGVDRYAKVALADGTALKFRTATASTEPCEGNCFPVIQTVIAEVPDSALRAAASGAGLPLTITLDNGHSFEIRAPAAYVQGYLLAVDAG